MLPVELRQAAKLGGGIIGSCELTGCIAYRSEEAFAADQPRHLNEPAWFRPPVLYGFTIAGAVPLPFRPYPGWVRFFAVKDRVPRRKKAGNRAGSTSEMPNLFSGLEQLE
jgi:hypothetical protein